MKKFLLICCMLLFLCSCTQGPVTEDNTPPNNSYEKDSASADAEERNKYHLHAISAAGSVLCRL